jgi:hypothetical protein
VVSTGNRDVDWRDPSITTDLFDEYRIAIYDPNLPVRSTTTQSTVAGNQQPSNATFQSTSRSATAEFRKGIKRDKSHYSKLKDEKNWDSWRRSTISTVYAHGCENILSGSYTPTSTDEILLFKEQNKFMYDVFNTILGTTMGQHFVTQHESTRDAQQVWKGYVDYMRTSTRADLEVEDLMTALTSQRLDSSYNGTTQEFIIDWVNNMRIYESLSPQSSHFPEIMKKSMLQNALNGLQVFRRVKDTELHEIARGQGALKYPNYLSVVQGVATTFDKSTKRKSPNRNVNMSQLNRHEDTFEDLEHQGEEFTFDEFEVHEARRRRFNRVSLPKIVWENLSKDDQLTWDKMTDQAKRAIMFAHKPKDAADPLKAQEHSLHVENDASHTICDDEALVPTLDVLAHAMRGGKPPNSTRSSNKLPYESTHPADIRRVLGGADGEKKMKANLHYIISEHRAIRPGSLIDRGANGGIAGSDVRVISKTDRTIDVSGIDDHRMNDLRIVTAGGVVKSHLGDILVILHQYAHAPQGKTIHSCLQLEDFFTDVDDRSTMLKGSQRLKTLDGYVIPLDFSQGLSYLPIRPFNDDEWNNLPHVVLTCDTDWDPSKYDNTLSTDRAFIANHSDVPLRHEEHQLQDKKPLTAEESSSILFGDMSNDNDHEEDQDLFRFMAPRIAYASVRAPPKIDFLSYAPYFLGASPEVIKRTFQSTTQYARSGWITGHIYDTHKAPFPALNVARRNEPVATDTIFSDTPSVWGGYEMAQFFTGRHTRYNDLFEMTSENQFVSTLQDVIRKRGAMDLLISDRAQVEISKKVQDVLRHYCIDDWQSEPHQQHQNYAERRIQILLRNTNHVLNVSRCPPEFWLFGMKYVIFILNRMALEVLGWRTPYEALTGSTPDISMISRFKFWDLIIYATDDSKKAFPSRGNESMANFIGFSESVGHLMTYILYTHDTQQVIYRSRIKHADDHMAPHDRPLTAVNGGGDAVINHDNDGIDAVAPPPPIDDDSGDDSASDNDDHDVTTVHPTVAATPRRPHLGARSDTDGIHAVELDFGTLIGRTFLSKPSDDGERVRLRVIERLDERDNALARDPNNLKFRCTTEDGELEEVIAYNEILEYLEKGDGDDGTFHFKKILEHQGPLKPSDDNYKGSKWNVKIHWETEEITWEPLRIIAASDPVSCAIYASQHGLLHLEGWKGFARLARRQKKMIRMARQTVLQAYRHKPVYKYGVQVPRNHRDAMALDAKNGNKLWFEAETKELNQIDEYETFNDHGPNAEPPPGYKKIRVHMVYDVKHNGTRKARLVAGGHLTGTPIDSVYSKVVSLRGLKTVIFLAELSRMPVWATDIGNAYLESITKEKLYIVAGPEFKEREGHLLVFYKACYGLKSSGIRWHERLSDVLLEMGFSPTRTEDDIWMRRVGNKYEYIARYVDDLAIVSNDPAGIIKMLTDEHRFKLKGTGPISYHLGCSYERDKDGVLRMGSSRYIERMSDNYHIMFGERPKTSYTSPLEKGDHPELDVSEELDEDGVKKYQSVIGALQWAVTIGRFDVATAVMTLSKFRATPRIGHMERAKRVIGYLCKMKHGAIRFRTNRPDYSALPKDSYDWARTVYGNVSEVIPGDVPEPLGEPVITTHYVDANLNHDVSTGRAVTGVLHFFNQTLIEQYCKKQATVQTATFGSEMVSARTATEQIMELRTMLRYLGVNIEGPAYMFGDNRTVVNSCIVPNARLHKRHELLSFHRVREAIAAGTIAFHYIPGSQNPADIVSKHWGYQQIWKLLQPLMFWSGNTLDLLDHNEVGD